jgi:hypothetical protein
VLILVLLLFTEPPLLIRQVIRLFRLVSFFPFLTNEPFEGVILVVNKNITTISIAEILVREGMILSVTLSFCCLVLGVLIY